MGWFENQIRERTEKDEISVINSFYDLSSVIMGKSKNAEIINNDRLKTKSAVEEICKFYKAPVNEEASDIEDMNEQLEFLLRPSGIMRRRVTLSGEWWKDCLGALLGITKSGDVVALIPSVGGYSFFDYITQKRIIINAKNAEILEREAVCFYKPLPNKPIKIKDIAVFMLANISKGDTLAIGAASLVVALLGLFTPYITQLIFSDIIAAGESILIMSVGFLLMGTAVSAFLINVTKNLLQTKVTTKLDIALQSAVMGRVINLPTQFFKQYSAGELSSRVQTLNHLCGLLSQVIFGAGLTAVFSFIYIIQIISIAPTLVFPAIVALLLQIAVAVLGIVTNLGLIRKKMIARTKVNGIIFSLFSGIQKIKLGGNEKRAFAKWAKAYKEQADAAYNPPFYLKLQPAFASAAVLTGMLLIYAFAAGSNIAVYQYIAFNAAYGLVCGAVMSLVGIAGSLANVKPILEMAAPILENAPEVSENKKMVKTINGAIELNNVSFRYTEDSPMIIDNLSLKIRRGQYVGIVGKTGCGKSTLVRMMLGFETPKTGAIYYDGEDMSKIDLKSLRRHIGVVMQNGKLFQGDIFSNIIISAPSLTLKDAWEAAEMAGVADDIKNMPMGMHTIISEGSGGISGGQRQRLMIARAIAPKPKILMFDEATSALDNITQKQVAESLANLKSTRIVIAHRLSTIKQCDRIIVLDKGKIVEDGNYDALVALDGVFADLVKRQQIDTNE
jgi:NHLM bacteriocin system ABC transporter ATP-binding protein